MQRKAIYITSPGARLQRSDGTLAVSIEGRVLERFAADQIGRVMLFGNAQLTTQALSLLFQVGASVAFFSGSGRYRGQLVSPESGNVFVRLAQHQRYGDVPFRLRLARDLVATKLTAARDRITRFANNHPDTAAALVPARDRIEGALGQLAAAANDATLRGLEGAAAAAYFSAFNHMVRPPFLFERRSQHPAHNPVNALLNLGYTLLTIEISGQLEAAGFDPRIGYYHGVRYGRQSLALDLIEAHRVDVIDRLTLSILNRRMFTLTDFAQAGSEPGVRLTPAALSRYLALYEAALGSPLPGEETARVRIQCQVHDLRKAILGQEPSDSSDPPLPDEASSDNPLP